MWNQNPVKWQMIWHLSSVWILICLTRGQLKYLNMVANLTAERDDELRKPALNTMAFFWKNEIVFFHSDFLVILLFFISFQPT